MKKSTSVFISLLCVVLGIGLIGGCLFSMQAGIPGGNTTETTQSTTTTTTTVTTTTTTTVTTTTTTTRAITTTAQPTTNRAIITTVPVQTNTSSHSIKNVPLIKQFPAYPTGCETISAIMALRYVGETVSPEDFINNHLEKGNFFNKDGKLYGPDPYDKFVGDPRNEYSLGCFAPVMERALISYFGNSNRVKNTTGLTMDQLCTQYIEKDIPVLVWVSIYMEPVGLGTVWYNEKNGEKLQWRTNEHCMVLVGYDQTHYYFNDPYSGKQLRYAKSIAKDRHAKFENQSLVITK